MATVIIVTGPPATGKSTLARELAVHMRLPVFGKDRVKETLFDTLGWSDRAWSQQLGAAAIAVLYAQLADTLGAGASCIAESTFRRGQASQDFHRVLADTGANAVQLQCVTDGPTLLRRFTDRAASERHPGHRDEHNIAEFRAELLAGRYEPLDIPGPVLTVDTTDFQNLPLTDLIAQLTAQMTRTAR
ncbi:AAA family ATPase [Actinophytocola sediminis]